MKNQFSDKSEALLRQKATDSLMVKRSDLTKKWFITGSKGYKLTVIIAWIAAVYNLIVFLAQTFGLWLLAADNSIYTADARTITVCCALIAISAVLLVFKKHLLASVASLLFGVFYLINSRALWLDAVIHNSKQITSIYIFIPSTIIAVIAAISLIAMVIVDRIQLKVEYNRILEKITRTYSTNNGEVTTQEQWEERISQYMEPVEHKKPKKSLRAKARKQKYEEE